MGPSTAVLAAVVSVSPAAAGTLFPSAAVGPLLPAIAGPVLPSAVAGPLLPSAAAESVLLSAVAGPLLPSAVVDSLPAAAGLLPGAAGPSPAVAGPYRPSASAGTLEPPTIAAIPSQGAEATAPNDNSLSPVVDVTAPSPLTSHTAASSAPRGSGQGQTGLINFARRARVAAMHQASFPKEPVAAVVDAPPRVKEVPPVAGPHPTLSLWEGISQQTIRFHTDQGSAFTVLREAEARGLGLTLEAVTEESGLPSSLMQADGQGSGLQVVGMVRLRLHVPSTDLWLGVTAVVVDQLFCAFLLGRNVMNAMDEAYGRSSVWDDGGRAMPAAQAGLAALKSSGATAKVTSVGRVMAPACDFDAGEAQFKVLGEMWLPEDLLSNAEGRVATVQGFFTGATCLERKGAILMGCTITTATLDWSTSGLVGTVRRATVVVDAVAAVSRGHRPQLLFPHEVLGDFFLGRPVIAAAAPSTSAAGLLQSVLEKTFAESPFLADVGEQAKARAAISGFMLQKISRRRRQARCCRFGLSWSRGRARRRAATTPCPTRRSCLRRPRSSSGCGMARSSHRSPNGVARLLLRTIPVQGRRASALIFVR